MYVWGKKTMNHWVPSTYLAATRVFLLGKEQQREKSQPGALKGEDFEELTGYYYAPGEQVAVNFHQLYP